MNEKFFLKKIPVPITITKNDKITYVNEEAISFTGYKEEELIGKNISLLYPSLFEFESIKESAEENKGIRGLRTKLKNKQGEIVDVAVYINLLRYEDGSSGGIGAVLDISSIVEGEEKLQKNIEKLHFLYNTLRTLTSSLDLDEIIKKVVNILRDYFNIEVIALSFLEEKEGKKYSQVKYTIGYEPEMVKKFSTLPIDEWKDRSNVCHAIYTGKLLYIPDATKVEKNYLEVNSKVRSSLAIPIKFKEHIFGGIVLESTEIDRFSKEDIELLNTIIDIFATVIVNARLYEQTLELSIKDALTDTYNHRYFYDQLHKEIGWNKRYGTPFSLAILDLDKFKRINDTYGHIEGDRVLRKIGKLLKTNVRNHIDVVCRYGGDEFSIIFPHTNLDEAKVVTERLLYTLNKENKNLYGITMSIGLKQYEGESPTEFIAKTDALTYKAKQKGGNRIEC